MSPFRRRSRRTCRRPCRPPRRARCGRFFANCRSNFAAEICRRIQSRFSPPRRRLRIRRRPRGWRAAPMRRDCRNTPTRGSCRSARMRREWRAPNFPRAFPNRGRRRRVARARFLPRRAAPLPVAPRFRGLLPKRGIFSRRAFRRPCFQKLFRPAWRAASRRRDRAESATVRRKRKAPRRPPPKKPVKFSKTSSYVVLSLGYKTIKAKKTAAGNAKYAPCAA